MHQQADMVPEVRAAAGFVSGLLRCRGLLSEHQVELFNICLQQALSDHYQHHWFPDRPQRGSGYRCIRINHEMDPIVVGVASRVGLSVSQLVQLLPRELTLWVDPYEVSYRIGEDGSICVLYEAQAPHSHTHTANNVTCKSHIMGRRTPSKNYLMTVSS